jgi:hypothetical protein
MRCEWRVVNHRVSGTLETNTWTDPATGLREGVIERIEAEWIGGDARGPAPLIVDGRRVGSAWQRAGTEPDPVTFVIDDPVDRSRSYLYLFVTYAGGGHVEAQMAIFTRPVSAHGKQIILDNRNPSAPHYLVTSARAVSGLVAYNWQVDDEMRRPLFEAVSHGGLPVPTDGTAERRFGGSRVFREGQRVNADDYSDSVIDDFEIFASGDAAFARYAGIEPLVSPHPDGPVYVPAAELRRRYQPMEREFMRAFVAADPGPFVIRLAAESD